MTDAPDFLEKDKANRIPITGALMLATLMHTLDSTIANVALPNMQGSISASPEQLTWVLTSYILATAVMTPLCGWLAMKFGRKRMIVLSIIGFTRTQIRGNQPKGRQHRVNAHRHHRHQNGDKGNKFRLGRMAGRLEEAHAPCHASFVTPAKAGMTKRQEGELTPACGCHRHQTAVRAAAWLDSDCR